VQISENKTKFYSDFKIVAKVISTSKTKGKIKYLELKTITTFFLIEGVDNKFKFLQDKELHLIFEGLKTSYFDFLEMDRINYGLISFFRHHRYYQDLSPNSTISDEKKMMLTTVLH
jgi:hypothetical protein